MTRSSFPVRAVTVASVCGSILFAGGCGEDEKAQSTPAEAPAAAATAEAPPPSGAKKVSGEPVVLAMINNEGGPVGNFPQLREAAQAAVKWVNETQGGVHGRPIELRTCVSDGNPQVSAGCANKLIDDRPVAIVGGADFGTAAAMPIFEKADLAYLGGTPFAAAELTSDNSVQFYGFAAGVFPALSRYAGETLKVKKVALIYPQLPFSKFLNEHYILPVLEATGVEDVNAVETNPSSADVTSSIAAALSEEPDAVMSIVNEAGCVPILRGVKNLGAQTKVLMPGGCAAPKIVKAAGDAAEGMYFGSSFVSPFSPEPDVKQFQAALKQYASDDITINDFTQAGFSSVVNVARILNEVPEDDMSTKAILAEARSGADKANFMAHPYTCDGKQVPTAPALCNGAQRVLQIKDGKPVDADKDWVNGSEFIRP